MRGAAACGTAGSGSRTGCSDRDRSAGQLFYSTHKARSVAPEVSTVRGKGRLRNRLPAPHLPRIQDEQARFPKERRNNESRTLLFRKNLAIFAVQSVQRINSTLILMYAIVEIAGQQFKVEKGRKLYVHRLAGDEGSSLSFDKILLTDNDGQVKVGTPVVEGAAVSATISQTPEGRQGNRLQEEEKERLSGQERPSAMLDSDSNRRNQGLTFKTKLPWHTKKG